MKDIMLSNFWIDKYNSFHAVFWIMWGGNMQTPKFAYPILYPKKEMLI